MNQYLILFASLFLSQVSLAGLSLGTYKGLDQITKGECTIVIKELNHKASDLKGSIYNLQTVKISVSAASSHGRDLEQSTFTLKSFVGGGLRNTRTSYIFQKDLKNDEAARLYTSLDSEKEKSITFEMMGLEGNRNISTVFCVGALLQK